METVSMKIDHGAAAYRDCEWPCSVSSYSVPLYEKTYWTHENLFADGIDSSRLTILHRYLSLTEALEVQLRL